jgi:cold shock CspA family protein
MTDTKPLITGKIIKVQKEGYGFISSKEIPFTRIFFHWTALRQDTLTFPELSTGMLVEFTPYKLPDKGYRAYHIRVIDKPIVRKEEEENEVNVPILQERLAELD